MWPWLSTNAPAIQAICAVFGIIGLAIYAWETRKLRKLTLVQTEASRRPFFLLTGLTMQDKDLRLKNVGVGIALNVVWNFDSQTQIKIGSLAPTEKRQLSLDGSLANFQDLIRANGMRVLYSDTAHKRYWTTFIPERHGELYIVVTDTGPDNARKNRFP